MPVVIAAINPATLLLVPVVLVAVVLLILAWAPSSVLRRFASEHIEPDVEDTADAGDIAGTWPPPDQERTARNEVVYQPVVLPAAGAGLEGFPPPGSSQVPESPVDAIAAAMSALAGMESQRGLTLAHRADDAPHPAGHMVESLEVAEDEPELPGGLEDIFTSPFLNPPADQAQSLDPGPDDQQAIDPQPAGQHSHPEDVTDPDVREASGEKDAVKRKREKQPKSKIVLAEFPYDPEVWEDPLPPAARRRKQRKAVKQAVLLAKEQQRVSDSISAAQAAVAAATARLGAAQKVLDTAEPALFADVWGGPADPSEPADAASAKPAKVQRRQAAKAAKQAEKARRKLDKLLAEQKELESRELPKPISIVVDDSLALGSERGCGADAFMTDSPSTWDSAVFAERPLPLTLDDDRPTWEIEALTRGAVLADFDTFADPVSEEPAAVELSARARKKATRAAQKESQKLAKLNEDEARKAARREQKETKRQEKLRRKHPEEPELDGLGGASIGETDEGAWAAAAGRASVWETAALAADDSPSSPSATTWEEFVARPAGESLGASSVSPWDEVMLQQAAGEATFGDPDVATSAEEWLTMGELITPVDDQAQIEAAAEPKRRKLRRKREEEAPPVVLEEWSTALPLAAAIAEPKVDHREFDLPEPIPDRVVTGVED